MSARRFQTQCLPYCLVSLTQSCICVPGKNIGLCFLWCPSPSRFPVSVCVWCVCVCVCVHTFQCVCVCMCVCVCACVRVANVIACEDVHAGGGFGAVCVCVFV